MDDTHHTARSDLQRTPTRILIIEDDPDTADLVIDILNEYFDDVHIDHFARIEGARQANVDNYDIALCDFNLPDGTGYDALESILERRDDLPIIMVTGEQESSVAIESIRRGAVDYILKTIDFLQVIPIAVEKNLQIAKMRRDNARLQTALASSLAQLKRKNSELEEAASRFEEMATTDSLTGLHNRRRFQERLETAFAEADRYNTELSCIMIDLDGFKSVNDNMGHQKGDELLQLVGQIIHEQVRATDITARYGGDEFVVVLPHTSAETAASLAQRLVTTFLRRAPERIGHNRRCAMSAGIASMRISTPEQPAQLVAHADKALYAAKKAGRGIVMQCEPDGETATQPQSTTA